MLLGFVLIGQSVSLEVYKWGMIILMLSAFLQIVVGNIPPETQLLGTLLRLVLGLSDCCRGLFDWHLAGSLPGPTRWKKIMVEVELQDISKSYARKSVLKKVDLQFEKGKFSVVFGSPVSGKSVLMRLIMGLESADSGSIFLRGREVTHLAGRSQKFWVCSPVFCSLPSLSGL